MQADGQADGALAGEYWRGDRVTSRARLAPTPDGL
jgi:hypothetical protein